jgi:hypothetical protein
MTLRFMMKNFLLILIFFSVVSCEKNVESEVVNKSNTYYPLIISVSTDADSSFLKWTKKNSFDHGADTITGKDSISWSVIYNNGTLVSVSDSVKNGKATLSIFRYYDEQHMELVSTVSDSGSNKIIEVHYQVSE